MILRDVEELISSKKSDSNFREIHRISKIDSLKIQVDGNIYHNFSSNDYLNLSDDPNVIAVAQRYAEQYGVGSASSRLITGNMSQIEEIEDDLNHLFDKEASLIFPSGFQLNYGILESFKHLKDVVFIADKYVHASIIDGIQASGHPLKRFPHTDYHKMNDLIGMHTDKKVVLVLESIYSMEGDYLDADQIKSIKKNYPNILIYIDIAHSFGTNHDMGRGISSELMDCADFIIGTFGKAVGSSGAFISCTKQWRSYFINFCRSLIYSTAISPMILGAIKKALEIIQTNAEIWTPELNEKSRILRNKIRDKGYDCGCSDSHIIPIIIGDNTKVLELSMRLKEHGYWVTPIRTPTVPQSLSRIRIAVTRNMSETILSEFVDAL